MRRLLMLLGLLVALGHAGSATTWVKVPLPVVADEADLIVVGRIVRLEERILAGASWTVARIRPDEVLKGRPLARVDLAWPRRGDMATLAYRVGTDGVWLLHHDPATGTYRASHPAQHQPRAAREKVLQALGPPSGLGPPVRGFAAFAVENVVATPHHTFLGVGLRNVTDRTLTLPDLEPRLFGEVTAADGTRRPLEFMAFPLGSESLPPGGIHWRHDAESGSFGQVALPPEVWELPDPWTVRLAFRAVDGSFEAWTAPVTLRKPPPREADPLEGAPRVAATRHAFRGRPTFRPDGRLLVAPTSERLEVYDPTGGPLLASAPGGGGALFRPGTGILAVDGGVSYGVDAAGLTELPRLPDFVQTLLAVAPDGDLLAYGEASSDQVEVWSAPEARRIAVCRLPARWPGGTQKRWRARFSPGGDRVFLLDSRGRVGAWDLRTGRPQPGGAAPVVHMDAHPERDVLATADEAGRVRLWDTVTWKILRERTVPAPVSALAFDPAGDRLAVGARGRLALLDGRALRDLDPLWLTDEQVEAVSFAPAGDTLAVRTDSGHTGAAWRLLETARLRPVRQFGATALQAAAFSPDGGRLLTGSDAGRVTVWDLREGSRTTSSLPGPVTAVAWTSNSAWVTLHRAPSGVRRLRHQEGGRTLWEREVPEPGPLFVRDGAVRIGVEAWSLATGAPSLPEAQAVAVSPSYIASWDGTADFVQVRDRWTGERLDRLAGVRAPTALAFLSDGRLATSMPDGVALWDLAAGEVDEWIDLPWFSQGSGLWFSPDERWLAVADASHGTLQLVDRTGARPRLTLGEIGSHGDWYVVDAEGHFDGSAGGVAFLEWEVERKQSSRPISEARPDLRRPGLLRPRRRPATRVT